MLRKLAMLFAVASLGGCELLPARQKSASDFDQALLDQQLIDAARTIERTQAELRGVSVVGAPTDVAVARMAQQETVSSSKPITIDWSGDASDLARLLAMREGLGFDTRGIKVPLPISLSVKQLPYDQVLAMFAAQIDYRATLYKLPGRMVLEYAPTTGMTH
ncbi:MAG: DotD/TraH family lipoprotein [Dyella sp.]